MLFFQLLVFWSGQCQLQLNMTTMTIKIEPPGTGRITKLTLKRGYNTALFSLNAIKENV